MHRHRCLVRQRGPGSVRLTLSGHTDEKDIARVTNLAHQFISKPCETGDGRARP